MEEHDDKKKEYLVTDLNSYLNCIAEIKRDIKRSEGGESRTKHYFFRGQASKE